MDMYLALGVVTLSFIGSICGVLSVILWVMMNRKINKVLKEIRLIAGASNTN